MSKDLTIAVAVYNIENYLDQCLSSFADERLKDSLEVLVINDGSKDSSLDIAKKYETSFPEIFKVVNKENGGYGTTFREGFKNATGKYYKVVDGDDYVNTEELVKLVTKLQNIDADFVITDFTKFDNNIYSRTKRVSNKPKQCSNDVVYDFSKVVNVLSFFFIGQVVYKTELLKKYNITVGDKYYVDLEYTFYPLFFVSTVSFLDCNVTMYRTNQSNNSTSKSNILKMSNQVFSVVERLLDFYIQNIHLVSDNAIKDYLNRYMALQYDVYYYYILLRPVSKQESYLLSDINNQLLKLPEIYEKSNAAVSILRKFKFTYPLISLLCKIRFRIVDNF